MKRYFPWIISLVFIGWAVSRMLPPRSAGGFDLVGFGRLPVLVGGRVMPLDSLARVSLLTIKARQQFAGPDGKQQPAIAWLADTLMFPEHADSLKVFQVTNPDVLDLLGWSTRTDKNYSFDDLRPMLAAIEKQSGLATQAEAQTRSAYQREIIKLRDALLLYLRLKNAWQVEGSPDFAREVEVFERIIPAGMQAIRDRDAKRAFDENAFNTLLAFTNRYQNFAQAKYVYAVPDPKGGEGWQHEGEALLAALGTGQVPAAAKHLSALVSAYRNNDVAGFSREVTAYETYLAQTVPNLLTRPHLEVVFNQAAPFLQAMILYLVAFLCAVLSWLFWPRALAKSAMILVGFAFALHTGGLLVRMYLQGRPPVTNLYSSAIFVGWGAIVLCLFLERFYRNGIGTVCASTVGFVTLLIAYNLQQDGDTMEMLRAVLDTNVWLATHVVCVTLGYASVFLAGLLSIIYIFRGVFTTSFDRETAKSLGRMLYGIVCFATLFSLVGTILGGIWADQSWGRFWGWDPKENGALLIVLWNAIILHARWGGFVQERGMAVLGVFGNVVCSWSWFGTNMLGVGLHSYGFMDRAFGVLVAFISSQAVIMLIGLLPEKYWRGIRSRKRPVSPLVQVAPV